MLPAIVVLQILLLVVLLFLVLKRPAAQNQDPRQAQLPDQITQLHGKHDAFDTNLRGGLTDLRVSTGAEALATRTEINATLAGIARQLAADLAQTREDHTTSAAQLRTEVLSILDLLGTKLNTDLVTFRTDNTQAAGKLREDVALQYEAISRTLANAGQDARLQQDAIREALQQRLAALEDKHRAASDHLLQIVQQRLDTLNLTNTEKLEQMRQTVDEKLHATLHTRLTESFGQVTDQLNKVHAGLGEMSKLSEGVDDLSRIFTNVKSRGGFAEVQLGMLLEQMLAPGQFVRNARVKPNTQEVVEFAVRFPGHTGETLLPIDAKFPREDWERLEAAYTANDPALLAIAGKAFEAAIRTEGKRICEKYINPPTTTPHAIMFLPTEGLYAEVMRRDALQAEVQSKCQVTIAGPSTLSAILTSFQMGFHMLALQEKGDEVWKVLESAKTEFGKFGNLMDKVEGDVTKIQKTLGEVGVRTRAINRTLREVSDSKQTLEFPEPAPGKLALAAAADDF